MKPDAPAKAGPAPRAEGPRPMATAVPGGREIKESFLILRNRKRQNKSENTVHFYNEFNQNDTSPHTTRTIPRLPAPLLAALLPPPRQRAGPLPVQITVRSLHSSSATLFSAASSSSVCRTRHQRPVHILKNDVHELYSDPPEHIRERFLDFANPR